MMPAHLGQYQWWRCPSCKAKVKRSADGYPLRCVCDDHMHKEGPAFHEATP